MQPKQDCAEKRRRQRHCLHVVTGVHCLGQWMPRHIRGYAQRPATAVNTATTVKPSAWLSSGE